MVLAWLPLKKDLTLMHGEGKGKSLASQTEKVGSG
jgi:hypothetical protein